MLVMSYLEKAAFFGMDSANLVSDIQAAMKNYYEKRILIVDDDEGIVFSMARILRRFGIEVECYTTSVKVIEALDSDELNNRFDLFIVDIQMPEMTGAELITRHILKKFPNANVLPMTGVLDANLRSMLEGIGCVSILEKPFSKEDLLEIVEKMIERKN